MNGCLARLLRVFAICSVAQLGKAVFYLGRLSGVDGVGNVGPNELECRLLIA